MPKNAIEAYQALADAAFETWPLCLNYRRERRVWIRLLIEAHNCLTPQECAQLQREADRDA